MPLFAKELLQLENAASLAFDRATTNQTKQSEDAVRKQILHMLLDDERVISDPEYQRTVLVACTIIGRQLYETLDPDNTQNRIFTVFSMEKEENESGNIEHMMGPDVHVRSKRAQYYSRPGAGYGQFVQSKQAPSPLSRVDWTQFSSAWKDTLSWLEHTPSPAQFDELHDLVGMTEIIYQDMIAYRANPS